MIHSTLSECYEYSYTWSVLEYSSIIVFVLSKYSNIWIHRNLIKNSNPSPTFRWGVSCDFQWNPPETVWFSFSCNWLRSRSCARASRGTGMQLVVAFLFNLFSETMGSSDLGNRARMVFSLISLEGINHELFIEKMNMILFLRLSDSWDGAVTAGEISRWIWLLQWTWVRCS